MTPADSADNSLPARTSARSSETRLVIDNTKRLFME